MHLYCIVKYSTFFVKVPDKPDTTLETAQRPVLRMLMM